MSKWITHAALCGLLTACLVPWAHADEKTEKEAEVLFMQGEGRMKVASYDEAIVEFKNVIKRYPDTAMRYKAQFRQADALVALKKEDEALTLLNSVVKEEEPEWSPKALSEIGEIYTGQQKYSDAFRAYRQIITDYPESPMVDHAHFAIGTTHFKLGHFDLAAEELDKVGTAFASRVPDLQRVSPGEPLHVRIMEPNMVAALATRIPATLTVKSGDKEDVTLVPDAEGGDHFHATINTKMSTAQPNDGTLELFGNDTVTLSYKTRYIGTTGVNRTITMPVASTARMAVRDATGSEVRGVVVNQGFTIEVNDADRDTTDGKDTVNVDIKTKKKDIEKLVLTETGNHTGVFQGVIKTKTGAPAPDSGTIEIASDTAEGSSTQLNDNITASYSDERHLVANITGPRKISVTVVPIIGSPGMPSAPEDTKLQAALAIKSLLYKGHSLREIAATYRDLGQEGKSTIQFRKAAEQFQEILTKYPNAPEVEDALYGLFQTYVGDDQYDSAIGVITRITQKFPQSSKAGDALFELAALHVKREEYDKALGLYQSLLQRAGGTPLAEEANYNIITTYMLMLKPPAGPVLGSKPQISPQQVTFALDEFARNFPNSKRAPEALWQLVRLRYDAEDYRGAVDSARRMVGLYSDDVMTGRVLLLQGQAQYKLRDIEGAKETFANIIRNYGSEADQAQKLLTELEKKYGSRTSSGGDSGGGSTGGGSTGGGSTGGGSTGGGTGGGSTSGGGSTTPKKPAGK